MVNGEAEAECTRASLLGRYEIGRTLGEGNFGKVKYARHTATGAHFAIKILDRSKILSLRIDDQVSMSMLRGSATPPVPNFFSPSPSLSLSPFLSWRALV